jgi:hypothetical protein
VIGHVDQLGRRKERERDAEQAELTFERKPGEAGPEREGRNVHDQEETRREVVDPAAVWRLLLLVIGVGGVSARGALFLTSFG